MNNFATQRSTSTEFRDRRLSGTIVGRLRRDKGPPPVSRARNMPWWRDGLVLDTRDLKWWCWREAAC